MRPSSGVRDEKRLKGTFSGQRGAQVESELRSYISLMIKFGVRSYLEVGCKNGDTFYEIMTSLPPGSVGVALDIGQRKHRDRLTRAVDELKRIGYSVQLILGDSRREAIVAQAALFAPFDMVFIDGDHSYKTAKSDWENYGPMGKMVGFHDIHGPEDWKEKGLAVMEVPKLWREIIESGRPFVEFFDEEEQVGIGVLLEGLRA